MGKYRVEGYHHSVYCWFIGGYFIDKYSDCICGPLSD